MQPLHDVDDDVRLTPVAGFDVSVFAKDAMNAMDLDSTRVVPKLELEVLRAQSLASRVGIAAIRERISWPFAWQLLLLPVAAICAFAVAVLLAVRSP